MIRLDLVQTRKFLNCSTVSHLRTNNISSRGLTFSAGISSEGNRSVTNKGRSNHYRQTSQPIGRSRPMATDSVQRTTNAGDKLVNRLAHSTSPYVRSSSTRLIVPFTHVCQVRAHKDNPVAWQEWTPETIALAQRLNRLIFLSIGYSACHCSSTASHFPLLQRLTAFRVPCYGKGVFHVFRSCFHSQ